MSAPWEDLLPTSLEVGGVEYEIRSDYRAVLDICAALNDPELDYQERAFVALDILYPALESIPPHRYEEALKRCYWFIDGGDGARPEKSPRLMDWEQDFKYIVAPINRVTGQEVRSVEYMHWWTFLSAYMEIGDCTFAQIVRIRSMKAKGKRLDKSDQEWYRQNRHLVDFQVTYTSAEEEEFKRWGA